MHYDLLNIFTCPSPDSKSEEQQIHIFKPWDHNEVSDLMFQYKNILHEHGSCLIPIPAFVKHKKKSLTSEQQQHILEQIENGVETHLYMSNMDSIHIWKIKSIISAKSKLSKKLMVKQEQELKDQVWIEVEDLFVFQANHLGEQSHIKNLLNELISSNVRKQIFETLTPHHISLETEKNKSSETKKWIEVNRNLTYDYFIRHCDLQDNIYHGCWDILSHVSKHHLVNSEQARQQAVLYKNVEKLNFLRDSYESYLSAVLNELNTVYTKPFFKLLVKHEALLEAWEEVKEQRVYNNIRPIIKECVNSDEPYINSLKDFLTFITEVKSLLFSLKSKFERRIGKSEYLVIENFLGTHAHLIESFLCKKLNKKVEDLIDLKDWFLDLLENSQTIPVELMKDSSLKMTHLLTLLTSTHYEDNIMFKLIEEKLGKAVNKRQLSDEIQSLRENIKKAA